MLLFLWSMRGVKSGLLNDESEIENIFFSSMECCGGKILLFHTENRNWGEQNSFIIIFWMQYICGKLSLPFKTDAECDLSWGYEFSISIGNFVTKYFIRAPCVCVHVYDYWELKVRQIKNIAFTGEYWLFYIVDYQRANSFNVYADWMGLRQLEFPNNS